MNTPTDRYLAIVAMLQQILARIENLQQDIDEIDRTMKPHGDGTKPRRRR